MIAAWLFGLEIAGVTAATFGVSAIAFCSVSAAAVSPLVSTATISGPLKPGPKPSASQS